MNLRYELARLRTNYFCSGFSQRYRRKQSVPFPRYVVWDCSRRCNLRCVHCGATEETYDNELTTAQITALIDEIAALGVPMFAVTGGEPLLRRDIWQVLVYAHRQGLQTGLATNGFLLDEAVARQIQEAQVGSVQISIDGLERTHNEIRNNDQSFARAVRAIELLTAQQILLLSVATTVTPQNISELAALRQVLLDVGVQLWRLSIVMPIGRARSSDILLEGGQLASMLEFVRQNDGAMEPQLNNMANSTLRGHTPSASTKVICSLSPMRIYVGENLPFLGAWEKRLRNAPMICPIGFTACCIGVDGHVRGCPEQPDTAENREGSILERSFSQIWQEGFGRYRNRDVLVADQDCAHCRSKHICYGGCWVMREAGRQCIHKLLA